MQTHFANMGKNYKLPILRLHVCLVKCAMLKYIQHFVLIGVVLKWKIKMSHFYSQGSVIEIDNYFCSTSCYYFNQNVKK